MFEIKIFFSPENIFIDELPNLSDDDLRYRLFLGNVVFKHDLGVMKFDWGWIPLLDFVVSLNCICVNFRDESVQEERFEFTESDVQLVFQKTGDLIRVVNSISKEEFYVNLSELHGEVLRSYKEALSDILRRYPSLQNRNVFSKYLNNYDCR